jgi:predicted ester cyclase
MVKGGERSMSLEEYKAIVRKGIEEFNERNIAKLDEFFAPDYVDHYHKLNGREEFQKFITMLLKAFPDFHETIEDIISEGDKVWIRFKAMATHTGEFELGKKRFAPTGKKITGTGVIIYRILDSKITESWEIADQLDLFRQLGVIEIKEI